MKHNIDEMDNLNFNDDDINQNLLKNYIPQNENDLTRKEKYVSDNLFKKLRYISKNLRIIKDIKALYNYMKSDKIPIGKKFIVIAALIYFITPIDTIPDVIPIVGFLDDIGIISALVKYLGQELKEFYY
ncbi:MAG TPA: YkvA family protein [Ignavibacteriales bacterium]|nr:YkvA family protein [Ignavibacteriales bacterium]